jgi:hypothetical protein
MRAYVAVSGFLFGLLILVHAMRIVVERSLFLDEPVFVASTVASLVMFLWAVATFLRAGRH